MWGYYVLVHIVTFIPVFYLLLFRWSNFWITLFKYLIEEGGEEEEEDDDDDDDDDDGYDGGDNDDEGEDEDTN
jgi:hypothetical protein